MGSKRIQYRTIFFTVFIDILGFGIVIPTLPLYAGHFGATTFEIVVMVSPFGPRVIHPLPNLVVV
jgi:hypothetical protein